MTVIFIDPHSRCDNAYKQVRCDRCGRQYQCVPEDDYYCTPEGDHSCEACLSCGKPAAGAPLISDGAETPDALRSTPLARRTPLKRGAPLERVVGLVTRTGLRRMSPKKAAALAAQGKPPVPVQRSRYTGPSRYVVGLVWVRADGLCEFPACGKPAQDPHHRYERGNGGTGHKSPAAGWINQPSNVLAACRSHNTWCSNGSPKRAEALGWIIRDAKVPACTVPVLTRHSSSQVLLDDAGCWTIWAGAS